MTMGPSNSDDRAKWWNEHAKWDQRDKKISKPMPVHGKSLRHIINAIRKRSAK